MWEEAGRWIGPDDDPGYAEALAAGEVRRGPAEQREQMRAWLAGLVDLTLDEPSDWSGWDPERRRWTP
jgi:ring-1,2-phenylacetyl-CoA epoxidase subunit PaaA/ring-1,2-phenylacetyl-CoA epoxidase subunit PaaC